jgi:hypothetical protein
MIKVVLYFGELQFKPVELILVHPLKEGDTIELPHVAICDINDLEVTPVLFTVTYTKWVFKQGRTKREIEDPYLEVHLTEA